MTAAELLDELRRRGVRLWVENGALRFRAPKGALTPASARAMHQQARQLANLLQGWPPYWPLEAWQEQWGWVAVRDPFTGKVHEIRWRDCPEWLRRRAEGSPARGRGPPAAARRRRLSAN